MIKLGEMEIKCTCSNGFEYTKGHVEDMRAWGKIVRNYLKICRIYEGQTINTTTYEIKNMPKMQIV